jgi:L-ascorbate metabolism protein UlaG (beta-lactamase superfamily)
MKIKKLGHCCIIIETNGKRIMTDPGTYAMEEQLLEKNIHLIVITHEHPDHLHIDSLKKVLQNNPEAVIITNKSVGKLLAEQGLEYQVLDNKVTKQICGVELEAHDCRHEEMFEEMGQVENTAFFIDKRLFYPGDAFYNPGKFVEILALPVAGPWAKIPDAIRYALAVKPKICFPVHDGMLKAFGSAHRLPAEVLTKFDVEFRLLENGEEEF